MAVFIENNIALRLKANETMKNESLITFDSWTNQYLYVSFLFSFLNL